MRSKFKWIYTLVLAFAMQFSFAQEKTITGTVTEGGMPLPGVGVIIKGTSTGTETDFNGKYTIKAKQGQELEFSYIGMKKQTIKVGASNSINVAMESDGKLEEVVVIGYGKEVKKERLNGSTSLVDSKVIENRPNINFLQSIQSLAPGVAIAFNSGSPGSNKVDVIIRGQSSINASSDPLYVIDGMPLNQSFFRNLNPNDIENVVVLKDAASTSVYGNRGSNGVIVITTKKGKYKNSFQVNYSSIYGIAKLPNDKYDLTNGDALVRYQLEQLPITGLSGLANTSTPTELAALRGVNTDWRDVFYREATSTQQNLSFTSGGEKLNNYTSFGYMEQEGLLKNTEFRRFTFRTNFNGKSLNDKFKYSTNINTNFSKRRQVEQETRIAIGNNIVQNPVNGYLKSPGYLNPNFYQNGQQIFNFYGANVSLATPYTLMDLLEGNNLANFYNELKIFASTDMSYKLSKRFTYGVNLGVDFQNDNRIFANGPRSYLAIVRNQTLATPLAFGGNETLTDVQELTASVINRLNYNVILKEKHTIDFTAYVEYLKAHRRVNITGKNGLDPLTWVPGAGTGWVNQVATGPNVINFANTSLASTANAGTFSYFGVLDYDYDSIFGIGASLRRDSSFKFADENKWGTFWSVSGRVNLNKIIFKDNDLFQELKLRASYGTNGNQNISSRNIDATNSEIFLNASDIRDLNSSQAGYLGFPSIGINQIANKDLKWETVAQLSVGLDFNLKNKLIGTIEYYKKNTTDLFLLQPVSGVNTLYFFNANGGELENRGFELALRYKILNKENLKLDFYVNAAKNTNEIKTLPLVAGQTFINNGVQNIQQPGGPIDQFFLVPYVGVNQSTGLQEFLDINGNITNNPVEGDRRATGKNSIPVYQGGFGFDFDYKGFFINTYLSFATDFYKIDDELRDFYDSSTAQFFPVTNDLFNAWTPTNTNTDVPSTISSTNQDVAAGRSDRFLIDSSYLRFKNTSLGYNFPSKFLNKTFIKGLKIYLQAENLYTWTKWKGLDPEGFDSNGQGKYPNSRSFSFGLDINF
jgi:TonB-linked SusC/RagA family outer membrane protein